MKPEFINPEGEFLNSFELTASNTEYRRSLLHMMDVFEKTREELGNYTFTIGTGKNRLVVLSEPVPDNELARFVVVSQYSFFEFREACAGGLGQNWIQNPPRPNGKDAYVYNFAKAIEGNGKVKHVHIHWKQLPYNRVPELVSTYITLPKYLDRSDRLIRIVERNEYGNAFIYRQELLPLEAEFGLEQISKMKEKILSVRQKSIPNTTELESASNDFAAEADILQNPIDPKNKLNDE